MRSTRWLRISRSGVGRRSRLRYDGRCPGRVDPLDRRRAVGANARGSDPDRSRLGWRDDLRRPSGRAHECDSRGAILRGLRLWVAAGAGSLGTWFWACAVGWIAWWGVSACGERRRHPTDLRVDDVVDFWRVETLEPGRLLRLRAEMRGPGDAWLEWSITPEPDGVLFVQRAVFRRAAYSVGSIGTRSHRFIGSFSGGLALGIEQHAAKALTGSVERAGRSSARRDSWLVGVAWSAHDRTRWSCGEGRSR